MYCNCFTRQNISSVANYSKMAAALRSELFRLFHVTPSAHRAVFVRWKKRPPKWRDPSDISWASPLLERQQQQKEAGCPEEADRPPAMLHMVTRVRDLRGRPYWEKRTIEALGLDKVEKFEPVVHKNTPSVNKSLAAVKHLIQVIPISFPHGLPSSESDFHHCVLRPNGRLEMKKELHPLEARLTSADQEGEDKTVWTMDEETVEKATRKVLEQFSLSREYFPAKYVYRYNQDGKEYRYRGNQDIGGDRDWY